MKHPSLKIADSGRSGKPMSSRPGKENIAGTQRVEKVAGGKLARRTAAAALRQFKMLFVKAETKNLERTWELFFLENNWILTSLFQTSVSLFVNQAYVGGKSILNTEGRIADFLVQNNVTRNVAIVELKTHRTPLLGRRLYRGADVYPISEDLTGAVNQALDQRHNLQTEVHNLRGTGKPDQWFECFNPECVVIAGSTTHLPTGGLKSFELFRSGFAAARIVTFDEVFKKTEALIELFRSEETVTLRHQA